MRMKTMLSRLRDGFGIAFAAGLIAGLAAPALAGTFYSWTTESGVRAYSDDAKRVPARYRSAAQLRDTASLEGYERYTPIESGSSGTKVVSRGLRPIDSLPGVSAPPRATLDATGAGISINTGDLEIGLTGAEGSEPIVVEQVRVKPAGSDATRTVQVVRQGDRILAIIKPQSNQQDLGDIQDESKLLD